MAKHAFLALAVIVAMAAPAAAQDFGTDWIDRVTQQVTQERGPLSAQPWEVHLTGGLEVYFDDNIYLREEDETEDTILIPFGRVTVTYAEPRFEFQGDLLANYKLYMDPDEELTPEEEDLDDDEERLYLRARQASSRYSLELAQILQRVSDPIGVLFVERAERVVSNTIPRVEFDLTRQWAVEVTANYQVVRYEDKQLGEALENNAARVEGSLIYRTAYGFDLLAQVGWQDISYRADESVGAPPDAFGWYGRIGWRGYLSERFYAEILVGFDQIESDFFAGTSTDVEDETGGAYALLRYEFTETIKASAEYSRQFTFAGAGDPYQRVDRVLAIVDMELTEQVGLKARFQWDHASTALSTERTYLSVGGGAWFKPVAWMIIDAGVTMRSGDAENEDIGLDTEYDNVIFHVGLAATY
ncbi:MAG TPA: hypothetical protein VF950_22965 [Planctomycetota bacterium]